VSFDLFQGLALRLGDEDVAEDTSGERENGVDPEQPVEADGQVDGGEELEDEEGHGQVEAGNGGAELGHRWRKTSFFRRRR